MNVGYGVRKKVVLKQTKMGKVYFMAKSYDKDIGELRSEICASNLGNLFNFPVQKAWFCVIPQYKQIGLRSVGALIQLDVRRQRYTKRHQFRENLIHGAALISDVDQEFSKAPKELHKRRIYTLDLVVKAIRNYVKNKPQASIVWAQFFELLTFDALIGGTDRHYNNWGILEKADDGTFLRLAPAFDNGISLLWKKQHQQEFLRDIQAPNLPRGRNFPKRARSMFKKNDGGKYTLYEALEKLHSIDELKDSNIAKNVLTKINRITEARVAKTLILNVPTRKRFDTSVQNLELIAQYVSIRLDLLKQTLNRIVVGNT